MIYDINKNNNIVYVAIYIRDNNENNVNYKIDNIFEIKIILCV